MSGKWGDIFSGKFGRFIMGIIKITLGGFIIQLVGVFKDFPDIPIGQDPAGNTVYFPVGSILTLLVGAFPLLLFLSALRDLDIHL